MMTNNQSTSAWKAAMALLQLIAIMVGIGLGTWIFQQVAGG